MTKSENELREAAIDVTDTSEMAIAIYERFRPLVEKRDAEIAELRASLAAATAHREAFAEGRDHLTVSGTFQSDKFAWSAANFVPLKITDPAARDLLAEYGRRRAAIDEAFPVDLDEALENIPAKPNPKYEPFQTIAERDAEIEKLKQVMDEAQRQASEAAIGKQDRARKIHELEGYVHRDGITYRAMIKEREELEKLNNRFRSNMNKAYEERDKFKRWFEKATEERNEAIVAAQTQVVEKECGHHEWDNKNRCCRHCNVTEAEAASHRLKG